MDVELLSPLPTRLVLWQSPADEWRVTVVSKVSYLLQPGTARIKEDPLELIFEDEHLDGDPECSVYAPSDLAPAKARADVILTGSAYAPRGKPVERLVARILVGDISKSIVVTGWRAVAQDGSIHGGAPFSSMQLSYEAAAGGPGSDNPVGLLPDARDSYGRVLLPTIYKENQVPAVGKTVDPVGLGAIGRRWPTRRARLGRHEKDFDVDNWRSNPLPADFDMGYFNVAPSDQQLSALSPTEALVLHNLNATNATLITRLPGIQPAVFIAQSDGRRVHMKADTLWIDSNRAIATLTFRSHMKVSGPKQNLTFVVTSEHVERPVSWKHVRQQRSKATAHKPPLGGAPAHTVDLPTIEDSTGLLVMPVAAPLPFSKRGAGGGRESAPSPARLPFDAPSKAQDPLQTTHHNWSPAPALPPPASPWANDGNTASGRGPATRMRNADPLAKPAPAVALSAPPAPSSARATGPVVAAADLLSLLWVHPDCAARIRRVKAYKSILDALDNRPVDWALDDAAPAAEQMLLDDRREVFEVMAEASPSGYEGLAAALRSGCREDGKFVPQLVLVRAELSTPFDAKARLKAMITTVKPLLADDADASDLGAAVANAERFLGAADELVSKSVLEGYAHQIQQAFEAEDRPLPKHYLGDETSRVLLNHRMYDQRILLGDAHLRSLLHFVGIDEPVPTYLALDLTKRLPLYRRFRVRVVAEVLPQEDDSEAAPLALRALALARVLPPAP